jgi:hypothetical protein
MKTFAYATTDEATLAAELADMSATAGQLSSDVAARNISAAQADAATLLDQAAKMGSDADDATARVKPLSPSDVQMKAARGDALDAFGLTADYASTASDLAVAAISLNLSELASVAQQAAALLGTSEELTAAYSQLTQELAAWAEGNSAAAATALAKYA